MSGLGNGFASFVEGFVGGRDTRNRWEDRKREIERQKVSDGYEADRQGRLKDMHGWATEQHGWNRDRHGVFMDMSSDADRLREQDWSDFTGMRTALADADAAAAAGMGIATGPVSPAAPIPASQPGPVEQATSAMTIPPEQRSTGYKQSVLMPPMGAGGDYAIQPEQAPGQLGAAPAGPITPAKADDAALLADAGDGKLVATRAPRTAAEKKQIAEAARAGRLVQAEGEAARQRQIDAAGTSRQQEGAVARTLRRNEDHEWFEPGGAGADIKEAAKLPIRGAIGLVDDAANVGLKGVRQVNTPVNAISRWITGSDFGQPKDVDALNRNAPDFPAPRAKEVAADAAKVAEEVTKAPAAPEMGIKPGVSLTPAQVERGAKTYMQSYKESGLPIATRELMRQGRFDVADSLRTFVNDAATQDGLNAYFGALGAAQMGDIDTAASLMIDAYNSSGYFDDGYQIDKADSELIRDDSGEVVGVRLAMVNQKTGEKIVQEDEIGDLIERGLWMLSPQKAVEQYLAKQQAMQTHLLELDKERREAGAGLIEKDMTAIDAAALEVMKTSAENALTSGEAPKTYEEALAEVMAARSQGAPSAPQEDDVPMLARPSK